LKAKSPDLIKLQIPLTHRRLEAAMLLDALSVHDLAKTRRVIVKAWFLWHPFPVDHSKASFHSKPRLLHLNA
jgi:hypothetical protein